jgi:hypothetical protein
MVHVYVTISLRILKLKTNFKYPSLNLILFRCSMNKSLQVSVIPYKHQCMQSSCFFPPDVDAIPLSLSFYFLFFFLQLHFLLMHFGVIFLNSLSQVLSLQAPLWLCLNENCLSVKMLIWLSKFFFFFFLKMVNSNI